MAGNQIQHRIAARSGEGSRGGTAHAGRRGDAGLPIIHDRRRARPPSCKDGCDPGATPRGSGMGDAHRPTPHCRSRQSKGGGKLPSTSEISERASPVSPGRRRPKRSRKIGKRHCEFRKGLFVNRPPMSFSRSSAGMRRRTLIGTGPLRAAPQTHEPVENPDSTLKDCLLDPGNFLAGLGN